LVVKWSLVTYSRHNQYDKLLTFFGPLLTTLAKFVKI